MSEEQNNPVDKLYIEDGEIFVQIKKGKITKVANWSPKIKALVFSGNILEGFVFEHPPKGGGPSAFQTHLSLNDISTHYGITENLTNKKSLTTMFNKEQHLPQLFLQLLDEYRRQEDQVIVTPLKNFGKQTGYIWVFCNEKDELLCYKLQDRNAIQVEFTELGIIRTGLNPFRRLKLKGDLDNSGAAIRDILDFCENNMAVNFSSICITLGAIALALHYSAITESDSESGETSLGIPVLIGKPKAGKSTVLSLLLSIIGVTEKEHCPTVAGMIKALSSSEVPVWWEDVENFEKFEDICLMVFNKSAKMTAGKGKESDVERSKAKTMPVVTTNGYFLSNTKGNMKAARVNRLKGRLIFIPYDSINEDATLEKALLFEKRIKELFTVATQGFGIMLSVLEDLDNISTDDFLEELTEICKSGGIQDYRELKTYGKVLFVTAKILGRCHYDHEFITNILKTYMENISDYIPKPSPKESNVTLNEILKDKLKSLSKEKLSEFVKIGERRSGCCGDVVHLRLTSLMEKNTDDERAKIRKEIVAKNIGCLGRQAVFAGDRKTKNCVHVKIDALEDEVISGIRDTLERKTNSEKGELDTKEIIKVDDSHADDLVRCNATKGKQREQQHEKPRELESGDGASVQETSTASNSKPAKKRTKEIEGLNDVLKANEQVNQPRKSKFRK